MNTPLYVRSKRRVQFTAQISEGFQCTYYFAENTKWAAFHEPDSHPDRPWLIFFKKHKVWLTEEGFRDLFEEV